MASSLIGFSGNENLPENWNMEEDGEDEEGSGMMVLEEICCDLWQPDNFYVMMDQFVELIILNR